MKKYKIVGICQIYNELEKGNLKRFLKYILPIVDELVVYDDGSTDGSYEYVLRHTPYVIRSAKNDFADEVNHKKLLLQDALKLQPNFILWLDADEVLSASAKDKLQELCKYCEEKKFDAIDFHELNIWRSSTWRRIDSLYNLGWFPRLWRVVPCLGFGKIKKGLHQINLILSSIKKRGRTNKLAVLHYGFADKKNLAYKYLIYRSHGQRGYAMLDRLISEEKLKLERIPKEMFPEGLWQKDDKKPEPLSFIESLTYVEKYKKQVFRPKYSIVCLIYKSVDWLKFVYEQVLKYTDLIDKEFYFVANDADEEVISYLKDNYIPHYIFNNTAEQKKEWYINNVYRAWNYAAKVAQGDFIVFINSDMAFTPGWFENLITVYNGKNCVTSRLVESGKLKSGTYGIEKDFGHNYSSYEEKAFQKYAVSISKNNVKNEGLYMPLLIRKEYFWSVGGYPEGNVKPGNDIFHPKIAQKGEEVIPGDIILMEKLKTIGVRHQTVFNSIVYHFQCGEMDEKNLSQKDNEKVQIAVCNDLVTGTMGEKVFWDHLLDNLPGTYGVDKRRVGKEGNFEQKARQYINKNYSETKIIVQNATFMDVVDQDHYIIAFLQDDLRSMGQESDQQESNLKIANKIVANSIQTALSYSDFDCAVLPIGADPQLFRPMNKKELRIRHGFSDSEKIGIFVGNFSEVKGWSKVKRCIKKYPEITWILVSKYKENYNAYKSKNIRVYNQIDQKLLAELLNCADFFIIGSPVETLCLAAVEACLCNIPLVMPKVGIFKGFPNEDCEKIGIFGDDLEFGIKKVFKRKFSPRDLILQKGLTIQDSMEKWGKLLQDIILEINIQKIRCKSKTNYREKKMPKVSIIMPIYNWAKFIEDAINSILIQDFIDWELIIIDDGSADKTKQIVKAIKDQRIIYVYQKNKGRSAARNKAIAMAKGEYLTFLDSDDMFLAGKLRKQVEFLDKNKNYGMVYTSVLNIDEKGKVLDFVYKATKSGYIYKDVAFLLPAIITLPAVMVRKDIVTKLGGFDDKMDRFEDTDMWRRMSQKYRIYAMKEPLTKIRMHSGNQMEHPEKFLSALDYYIKKVFKEDDEFEWSQKRQAASLLYRYYAVAIKKNPKWHKYSYLFWERSLIYWPLWPIFSIFHYIFYGLNCYFYKLFKLIFPKASIRKKIRFFILQR